MSSGSATLHPVPRAPRPIPEPERRALYAARVDRENAETTFRAAVLAALAAGGSVRDVARTGGISTSTVQTWTKEKQQ